MLDSHLQSIHLPGSRREEFRAARERLFAAEGPATRLIERRELDSDLVVVDPDRSPPFPAGHLLIRDQKQYPLRPGINILGRNHANDIIIRHPQVSRRHCSILVHSDGRCEIHNLASLNGTWLNGTQLTSPKPLADGDWLELGPVGFRFSIPSRHEGA